MGMQRTDATARYIDADIGGNGHRLSVGQHIEMYVNVLHHALAAQHGKARVARSGGGVGWCGPRWQAVCADGDSGGRAEHARRVWLPLLTGSVSGEDTHHTQKDGRAEGG